MAAGLNGLRLYVYSISEVKNPLFAFMQDKFVNDVFDSVLIVAPGDVIGDFLKGWNGIAHGNAKAGCLYPNNGRAIVEARMRGFDNALVLDMLGNVAETASSNIFLVKDGQVMTPAPNGTFLSGITRARTIGLLADYGFRTMERTLSIRDFREADEIFSTGNHSKIVPVTKLDDRDLQPGPIARKARELYWEFAHSGTA